MATPIAPAVPSSPYTGETEESPTAAKRRAALVSAAAGHTAAHQRTLTLPGELAKSAGGVGGGR